MSAAAPASAQQEQQLTADQLAALPLPKNQLELRQMIAAELASILSIPSNIQSLAASISSAQAQALHTANVVNQRMEAHPQLVRTEYPGSAKATILAPVEAGGEYDVLLEERGEDGEWKPLVRDELVLAGCKKLVLSQVTHGGDVWFITTTAEVNRHQDQLLSQQYAMVER